MTVCKGCVHAGETHFSHNAHQGAMDKVAKCQTCTRGPKKRGRLGAIFRRTDNYESKADVARMSAMRRGWGQGAKDNGHNVPGPPHPTRKEMKIIRKEGRT